MKKVTKVYKVYAFDELDEKGKEKAINNLLETHFYDEWWESVYEDAEQVSIKIKEFDIDRGNYIKIELKESPEYVAKNIMREHGAACDTHKAASEYLKERAAIVAPEFEDGDIDESVYDDVDDEFKRAIGEEYLSILRKEYEYQTSEEAIRETIEANEYEFTADGEIFHV